LLAGSDRDTGPGTLGPRAPLGGRPARWPGPVGCVGCGGLVVGLCGAPGAPSSLELGLGGLDRDSFGWGIRGGEEGGSGPSARDWMTERCASCLHRGGVHRGLRLVAAQPVNRPGVLRRPAPVWAGGATTVDPLSCMGPKTYMYVISTVVFTN
jgi:hypothetical protein